MRALTAPRLSLAGGSPQQQQTPSSVSPGFGNSLPAMQPLPSTFSRSPAGGASPSAPDLAPQDWLRQSEALSSLTLKGPGSGVPARELYRVDLQAASSSSPLSPNMQPRHGSAAPADMSRADSSLTRAVSARPFSIQQSVDVHKPARPQEGALPWLEVSEGTAAPNATADGVRDQDSPVGQESSAGQVQTGTMQPLKNPFAGQEQPASPQAWTFQAGGQQGMSLLDM